MSNEHNVIAVMDFGDSLLITYCRGKSSALNTSQYWITPEEYEVFLETVIKHKFTIDSGMSTGTGYTVFRQGIAELGDGAHV